MSNTMEERFWQYTDKRGPDECWLWLGGALFHNGKVTKRAGGRYTSHAITPISAAWIVQCGPVPPKHRVASQCLPDVCVNARHLVTGKDGIQSTVAAGRDRIAWGERTCGAKLTVAGVKFILRSPLSAKTLAAQFGIKSPHHIRRIRQGKSWKRVSLSKEFKK